MEKQTKSFLIQRGHNHADNTGNVLAVKRAVPDARAHCDAPRPCK